MPRITYEDSKEKVVFLSKKDNTTILFNVPLKGPGRSMGWGNNDDIAHGICHLYDRIPGLELNVIKCRLEKMLKKIEKPKKKKTKRTVN